MLRTSNSLRDDQLKDLRRLAAEERLSVAALVRRAVDGYLAQRPMDHAEWRRRFEELITRVHSRIPDSIPPEEIEADITLAREEVRQARRAARHP